MFDVVDIGFVQRRIGFKAQARRQFRHGFAQTFHDQSREDHAGGGREVGGIRLAILGGVERGGFLPAHDFAEFHAAGVQVDEGDFFLGGHLFHRFHIGHEIRDEQSVAGGI